jgi:hypothetical protein
LAEVEKKLKISRLSVILGVAALVLVLGTGAYFAYKNDIFASTSTTNQCTIKLASLNRTPNSFTIYILDQQNYNKIQQNPSATGVGTLANFSTVGDLYTLTGPGPVYFVGHKQNGELIFSTPFTCDQNQNVAVNADLSGGSITWTSASVSQEQGETGGQSYIVNNQLCIQEANGEYQVYNLNGRAWTSASGSSVSYDDGLSRDAPMSKCTSQSNGAGGITASQNTDTRKCAKWSGDGNFYWITSSDKTTWYPEKSDAPTNLKTGLPLNAFEIQTDTTKCSSTTSGQSGTVTATASATATTQRAAPINPELRVPTIGTNSGFPVGRSSVTLRAARYSYAGSPQYQGQNITPVGGVSFTINITTTYTSQTQAGTGTTSSGTTRDNKTNIKQNKPSSFLNNAPIAYAQTNSISDTSKDVNSKTDKTKNVNSTSNTAGGVNPITSGGGFTYKSGWAQTAIDEAKDAIKRLGKAYGVSTSGTIPDNGINSQIVITNLPPGDYSITLSKNGYKNTTIQFQLQDGEQKTVLVMMAPNAGAEPPSINSNAIMMEANKGGVFWANTTSGKYLYNAQSPWWGWQLPESYNTQQPYYDANGMPHSTNPYYSPVWGQNYQTYMNSCQNTSLAVGPGIDPTKAGLAATVFGLLQPHTGKTFLEDSLLPGLGTYFAAGAIQNSGASISVSQINQNCFSPQQTQYASSQGILPSVMSLLHLSF